MDTTLSILKILHLCFIILDLNGDHAITYYIHHTEIFLMSELIFIKFFMIN